MKKAEASPDAPVKREVNTSPRGLKLLFAFYLQKIHLKHTNRSNFEEKEEENEIS